MDPDHADSMPLFFEPRSFRFDPERSELTEPNVSNEQESPDAGEDLIRAPSETAFDLGDDDRDLDTEEHQALGNIT